MCSYRTLLHYDYDRRFILYYNCLCTCLYFILECESYGGGTKVCSLIVSAAVRFLADIYSININIISNILILFFNEWNIYLFFMISLKNLNSTGYQTNLSFSWEKKKKPFFPHYIFHVRFGLRTGIKVFYGEDQFS